MKYPGAGKKTETEREGNKPRSNKSFSRITLVTLPFYIFHNLDKIQAKR